LWGLRRRHPEPACKHLAFPMSSASSRYCTNTCDRLRQCTPSRVGLRGHATTKHVSISRYASSISYICGQHTSAGLIMSSGLVHCVTLVSGLK
jgi:hypothetical protein